ncbi:kinase-like domain-containing protein [Podospora fimiseda]|uniref:Kinase-like domain-containing protein n=1 Tax=Podospora fimiseda TaxID=252190 RepID=A0AAN7H0A9_9PEZI|nr:kinase-like domain-containing protein [Podospora fimiseda]
MSDAGEGWQTVMPTTHSGIERLARDAHSQLEVYERQILKEWEQSHHHWSGIGKHTPLDDFTEAKKLHARFKLANDTPLGTGSFGVVQKVTYSTNNRTICLARKQVRPPYRRFPIQLLREEASVMERLDHDHIVKLVGTYCLQSSLYILLWPVAVCNLECLFNDIDQLKTGAGDREDIIKRLHALGLKDLSAIDKSLPSDHSTSAAVSCPLKYLQQMMGCITRAVAYCHGEKIRHLDLKPSNILLNPGRVYLADFGIAKDVGNRDHTMTRGPQGTPKWRAPELNDTSRDWSMQAAEIYSLGLVLLNIVTVVHGGNLDEFDAVLGDMTHKGRSEKLSSFLPQLQGLALASQEVQDVNAFTFSPRHTIKLVFKMLDPTPSNRPSIFEVDSELVELGGLDQIYHSSCCKKTSRWLTERMNNAIRAIVDERDRLRTEHKEMAKRLEVLEAKDVTYESRIANERKINNDKVATLLAKLSKEQNDRKQLQSQVAELQPQLQKRQSRPVSDRRNVSDKSPGPTMPSRPRTHPLPDGPFCTPSSPSQISAHIFMPVLKPNARLTYSETVAGPTTPKSRSPLPSRRDSLIPAPPPKSPSPAAVTPGSPKPDLAGFQLRSRNSGSRLPLAVNSPATPVRSNTPILNRDPSSTDSTTYSLSSSSVFSRLSQSKLSLAETSVQGTPALGTPAIGGERRNSHTVESPEETNGPWSENAGDVAQDIAGIGLGIGIGEQRDSTTAREAESVKDTASVVSSVAPSGTISPIPSGSTFSSPRAAHAALEGYRGVLRERVPSLPTAKSWADVARKERRVQPTTVAGQ